MLQQAPGAPFASFVLRVPNEADDGRHEHDYDSVSVIFFAAAPLSVPPVNAGRLVRGVCVRPCVFVPPSPVAQVGHLWVLAISHRNMMPILGWLMSPGFRAIGHYADEACW